MQVTIIDRKYEYELADAINEWLKNNKYFKVIDIKYSGRGYSVPYGSSHVSAMIIYE